MKVNNIKVKQIRIFKNFGRLGTTNFLITILTVLLDFLGLHGIINQSCLIGDNFCMQSNVMAHPTLQSIEFGISTDGLYKSVNWSGFEDTENVLKLNKCTKCENSKNMSKIIILGYFIHKSKTYTLLQKKRKFLKVAFLLEKIVSQVSGPEGIQNIL